MVKFTFITLSILFIVEAKAQVTVKSSLKPVLDTTVFEKWESVGRPKISNNGNYFLYNIENKPSGTNTTVIKSIKGSYEKEFTGVRQAFFTHDSQKAILYKEDSIIVLTLGQEKWDLICFVESFRLFNYKKREYLAFIVKSPVCGLIIRDLKSGAERSFPNTFDFTVSVDRSEVLLKTKLKSGNVECLSLLSLDDWKNTLIWQGGEVSNIVFAPQGGQLSFIVNNSRTNMNEIWIYSQDRKELEKLSESLISQIDTNLCIYNILRYSKDNGRLYITLKEKTRNKNRIDNSIVEIWSYEDSILPSHQLKALVPRFYTAVIDIKEKSIFQLNSENETVMSIDEKNEDVALIIRIEGTETELNWNPKANRAYYLADMIDKKRKKIVIKDNSLFNVLLSPDGRYTIGIDGISGNYISYNVRNGNIINLTNELNLPLDDQEGGDLGFKSHGLQFAAWLDYGKSLVLYDKYDIWSVDPSGKSSPICLTNGYGRKNKVVFRLVGNFLKSDATLSEIKFVLAFNQTTKNSGFYEIAPKDLNTPRELMMGKFTFELPLMSPDVHVPKALDSDIYIVLRSDVSHSPNYFWTKDFKNFKAISATFPEKHYNWVTSELITWKSPDGNVLQGALYKPEDFDSTRKYPVIIHYYEKMSDKLNRFEKPEPCPGWINIPWFVSNGYLVFTPDIKYTIGHTGKSVCSSVISGVENLSKYTWFDTSRIGIQGHSFGGYETNYLITHSKLFAAAVVSAGMSDLISDYGSLSHGGLSKQHFYEIDQCRIGATLWEHPELYIENSPVFELDRVSTPILIMHNQADDAVSVSQGLELFLGLRRLKKKAWLLQYKGETHSLNSITSMVDYTIRVTEFFNYYLKGFQCPHWMIHWTRN